MNIQDKFQLITQGKIDNKNADWVLVKKNLKSPVIFGAVLDLENVDLPTCPESIEEKLNSNNYFDFEYTPSHGDIIHWKYGSETVFSLEYNYGKWVNHAKAKNIFGLEFAA